MGTLINYPLMLLDVVRFEFSRSMTKGRIAIWLVLACFPIAILTVLRIELSSHEVNVLQPISTIMYFLVAEVTCLLGLLLWATPTISTELEGQTWIYLATRPAGRSVIVLGKYITAVLWTFSAAMVSATICSFLLLPTDSIQVWLAVTTLSLLSCISHGALYVAIGAIFYRRTMVAAVIYTLVVEFSLSFIPALVNQLTINYRLRSLLGHWMISMEWDETIEIFSDLQLTITPVPTHVIALSIATVGLLVVTLLRLRTAQFPTQQDGGA